MNARFGTTHWSLVLAAGGASTTRAREALAALCEIYWYPVYAFVRRQGYNVDEARDLTQGYFLRLLEKNYLGSLKPEAGRFRSFLLASVKNFLANEWDKAHARKRRPEETPISLDAEQAEGRYRVEPVEKLDPEKLLERQWAVAVLERALARLRGEFEERGEPGRFDRLKSHLVGEEPSVPYSQAAAELGMSETAARVAVHRMRLRFGQLLREEIAHTVSTPEAVDQEIRHLLWVTGGGGQTQ